MSLFKSGEFTLHSGKVSNFLIDAEALTDEDLDALAKLVITQGFNTGKFKQIIGVPRGGLRFAEALKKQSPLDAKSSTVLLVDDVYTTGESLKAACEEQKKNTSVIDIYGLVIFDRSDGMILPWVEAVWTLHTALIEE